MTLIAETTTPSLWPVSEDAADTYGYRGRFKPPTYFHRDDTADAAEVAEIIGLSNLNHVSNYVTRHPELADTVIRRVGKNWLFCRSMVEAWQEAREARWSAD